MNTTEHKIDVTIRKVLGPLLNVYGISFIKARGSSGLYTMGMKFTPGIKWKMVRTKRHLIFTPDCRIKGIKNIHYTFPLPLGIWMHKTVVWESGRKEHRRVSMFARKFDFAKDFLKYKSKYGST